MDAQAGCARPGRSGPDAGPAVRPGKRRLAQRSRRRGIERQRPVGGAPEARAGRDRVGARRDQPTRCASPESGVPRRQQPAMAAVPGSSLVSTRVGTKNHLLPKCLKHGPAAFRGNQDLAEPGSVKYGIAARDSVQPAPGLARSASDSSCQDAGFVFRTRPPAVLLRVNATECDARSARLRASTRATWGSSGPRTSTLRFCGFADFGARFAGFSDPVV